MSNEAPATPPNGSTPSAETTPASESPTPGAIMEKGQKGTGSSTGNGGGGGGGGGAGSGSFPATFKAFSKFGDTKSDGRFITLTQSDKWMKQAKIFDGKKITTTDTGIHFKKQKSMKLNLEQYKAFLEDMTKTKKVDLAELMNKMASCGAPGLSGSAAANASSDKPSIVDRLTDTSKYTGAHKHRFDPSGKGKGIAGRRDVADSSGYVAGYKHKDTYQGK